MRIFFPILIALAFASAAHAQSLSTTPIDPSLDESRIQGPLGDAIRLGHQLATNTRALAGEYVGNGLACTSCHIDGGTRPYASPWKGVVGVFPEYSARSARVETLGDRINGCFERSMNGKAMPLDDARMIALQSYMAFLSYKLPTGVDGPGRGFAKLAAWKPADADATRGKALYEVKCSACHGAGGAGLKGGDGTYVFPPLWGPDSFNDGAGLARIGNAASFVKTNMPKGAENTLTEAEALDLAAFITKQPRPAFAGKARDWPNGGKPADAPY